MIFQSKTGLRNVVIAIVLIIIMLVGIIIGNRPKQDENGSYLMKDNYITKEHRYSSADKNYTYAFENEILESGKKFKLLKSYSNITSEKYTQPYIHEITQTGRTLDDIHAEENIVIEYGGKNIECFLLDIQYENTSIPREPVTATAFNQYYKCISKPVIPEKKEIDYYDEVSKTTTRVTCQLDNVDITQEARWVNDLQIPLTFHVYGADYYLLDGKEIPHNDDKPLLINRESEVLSLLGLSSSSYRIEDYKWQGGVYEENGEKKRNAIALGSRMVTDYKANYSNKNVILPDVKGITARIQYASKENLAGIVSYDITSTGIYAPVNNTLNYLLGAFLLLLFIVIVLYVIAASDERRGEK